MTKKKTSLVPTELSEDARDQQDYSMNYALSSDEELSRSVWKFIDGVLNLPKARRTIGKQSIEVIKYQAAQLKPDMVRSSEEYLTIHVAITKALDEMRGTTWLNENLKVRDIREMSREWFIRDFIKPVAAWMAQRIRERNHVDHANLSLTLLVNLIQFVVDTNLGRSHDNASSKFVGGKFGSAFDVTDPPLWATFNAACDKFELDEGDDFSSVLFRVLTKWLCKLEVKVYLALYDHVKELEVIYG